MAESEEVLTSVYPYSKRNLIFAAFSASFIFISIGVFMGWSSPALVLLRNRNFTSTESTMLVSLPGLAPGPLITMFGLDLIGRRYCLLLVWATVFACFAIMTATEQIIALLVARFIGGWGMGASFSVIGAYISEISDVRTRAQLNSATVIFFCFGLILVQGIGPFITYEWLSILCLAASLGFGIFFWFIPETPYYYVNKGKMDQAKKSLAWLRRNGRDSDVNDELTEIQGFIEDERKQKTGIRKLCSSKAVFKEFGVAWYVLAMQQLSGMGPLLSYSQTIFMDAHLPFHEDIVKMVPTFLNTISFLTGFFSPLFVSMCGYKSSMFIAVFTSGITHGVNSLYFFLLEYEYDVQPYSWITVLMTALLMVSSTLGLTSIVWAVVADLFSPSVKGYASGICGIFSTFLGFVVNSIFGRCVADYGYGYTFGGFGIANTICSFGICLIPDVSTMTLEEIQDYFEGKENTSRQRRSIS